jgi:hypothetical protein
MLFGQDGTVQHFSRQIMDIPVVIINGEWVCKGEAIPCTLRSPKLTMLGILFWGCVKNYNNMATV